MKEKEPQLAAELAFRASRLEKIREAIASLEAEAGRRGNKRLWSNGGMRSDFEQDATSRGVDPNTYPLAQNCHCERIAAISS